MAPLSNLKWEAFARAIVRGRPASHAYASVYHVTGNVAEAAAARLLRNVKVTNRLAELKKQAANKAEKTTASLVADLDDVIVFARQCNNRSAMVAAIAQQAKLLGLEAPRQLEIMHKPAPLPTCVLELTEEEWSAQFSSPPRVAKPANPLKQATEGKRPDAPVLRELVVEASTGADAVWLDLDEEPE